jgi:hypothetical protein
MQLHILVQTTLRRIQKVMGVFKLPGIKLLFPNKSDERRLAQQQLLSVRGGWLYKFNVQ